MLSQLQFVSLMLPVVILLNFDIVFAIHPHHHHYLDRWHLAVRDQLASPTTAATPCSGQNCVTATPHLPCEAANGTEIGGSENTKWTMICDIDFRAQDIYPFILSGSFEACLKHCEDYNTAQAGVVCAGFVFAPDRVNSDNDCYLKSSLHDAIYPATIHLVGATLQTNFPSSTSIYPIAATSSLAAEPLPTLGSQDGVTDNPSLTVRQSHLLGASVDNPTKQFVNHPPAKPIKMASTAPQPGIDVELIINYPLAADTGSWTSSSLLLNHKLSNMTVTPRLSRDGGRGGMVNGSHIFIFCDTSTFGAEKDPVLDYMNGFVSSSVAVDHNMNGLQGKALTLTDPVGQWQDDVGRMRGWIPMTTGEQAFNYALSGQGYRYAVWPESSPISINETHALLFAPLVYLDVDMQTQSHPNYTSLGNTLVLISIDPVFGPHAERLVKQFFREGEVSWGSLGGFRAWGAAGQGSSDGDILLFGQVDNGVLVAKVGARGFVNRSNYLYWNGNSWSTDMPPPTSASDAFLVDQAVMDMDLIYSPYHKTFIMIYLTPDADNIFYYRYLIATDNSKLNITAAYEKDGDNDYAEQMLKNKWSPQQVLFSVPPPERGYIYAGGIHAGYFGQDDITEGGTKMLCTWTEHTLVDPNKPESGYAHKAQIVELAW